MFRSVAAPEMTSSFFYLLHLPPGSNPEADLPWYQILTLMGQETVVVNQLQFMDGGGGRCIRVLGAINNPCTFVMEMIYLFFSSLRSPTTFRE